MDMGTHALHLVRTLFGPVCEVWAEIGNHSGIYPKLDDFGIAQLRFVSGVLGTVEAAWTQTGGIGGLEVVGSEKTIWNTKDGYFISGSDEPIKPLEGFAEPRGPTGGGDPREDRSSDVAGRSRSDLRYGGHHGGGVCGGEEGNLGRGGVSPGTASLADGTPEQVALRNGPRNQAFFGTFRAIALRRSEYRSSR